MTTEKRRPDLLLAAYIFFGALFVAAVLPDVLGESGRFFDQGHRWVPWMAAAYLIALTAWSAISLRLGLGFRLAGRRGWSNWALVVWPVPLVVAAAALVVTLFELPDRVRAVLSLFANVAILAFVVGFLPVYVWWEWNRARGRIRVGDE